MQFPLLGRPSGCRGRARRPGCLHKQSRRVSPSALVAIEPKEAGRIAGFIRIGLDGDESRQGNVGYSLDSDFQGRGYATDALKEVVRLGFEDLGLRRIWATVDTKNEKSRGVLERAGFRREDRMSAHRSIRGVPADSYLYAISNARVSSRTNVP